MKVYIVQSALGVFGINEKNEIADKVLCSDIKKIVDIIEGSKLSKEEEELVKKLNKRGYSEFASSKKRKNHMLEMNNAGEKFFRKNFRDIAKKSGYSDQKLNKLLTSIGIEFTRRKVKQTVKKDKIIIQAIDCIDEVDKSINIFVERLREWYGLHFPEMKIEKHEKFVKIIADSGLRKNIEEFSDLAKKSMGIDLTEKDGEIIKEYAASIRELQKLRERMEKYICFTLKEICPNFSELAGPLLAARLIALVGGLDRLAKKPSSTIQLLGSEKALFRFLSGKGRSPKHGIIFQHPYIQKASFKDRGRIARVLSSKLSIAVKIDYYGGEDKSKEMKKNLEELIKK